ncbi:MAG: phosphotransacetylase [bacterium]|nr:phosphotransacetylase [bacterium]
MSKIKTIIFPESYDERVLSAVKEILNKNIAKVVSIGRDERLQKLIKPHKGLTIIDADFSGDMWKEYVSVKKKKKNLTREEAEKELSDPLTFSCMLLKNDFADGIIAGSVYSTSEVLRNAISIIGLAKKNRTVSSFFLFTFPEKHKLSQRTFAYADCGVIPSPTAEQLSDIAIQTSVNFKKLTGKTPRLAFLSFSTKGSAKDVSIEKIIRAFELTKKREPKLICDAELQFDAAFVPAIAKRKNPGGEIMGDANIFIFPDLNSGNIAYKITERIGGAFATGPVIQGLAKPVMDLSRGCTANDIVNMTKVIVKM